MRLSTTLCAVLAISVAAPCAAQVMKTARVEFPGFSIVVPAGTVIDKGSRKAAGAQALLIDESQLAGIPHVPEPKLELMWVSESMTFETFREEFLPSLTAHEPAGTEDGFILREVRLTDSSGFAIFGTEALPIGLGVVTCHSKFSVALVLRLHPTVDSQADAMSELVGSVRCGGAANSDRPLANVRFPTGFGVVGNVAEQRFRSLGGEQIEIAFSAGGFIPDDELWRASEMTGLEIYLKRNLLEEWVHLLAPAERADLRPAKLLRVDLPDQSHTLYVGWLHCECDKLTYTAMIRLPRADDVLAKRRLGEIGCSEDEGLTLPPFDKLASKACREGNARACDLLR